MNKYSITSLIILSALFIFASSNLQAETSAKQNLGENSFLLLKSKYVQIIDQFKKSKDTKVINIASSKWSRFNKLSLSLKTNQQENQNPLKYEFVMVDCQGFRISLDNLSAGRNSFMADPGFANLTSGMIPKENNEIDNLDSVLLLSQLSLNILQHLLPGGPQSINKPASFDFIEKVKSIKIVTAKSTVVSISPPWKIQGTVERDNDKIKFNLNFSQRPNIANAPIIVINGFFEGSGEVAIFPRPREIGRPVVHFIGASH